MPNSNLEGFIEPNQVKTDKGKKKTTYNTVLMTLGKYTKSRFISFLIVPKIEPNQVKDEKTNIVLKQTNILKLKPLLGTFRSVNISYFV